MGLLAMKTTGRTTLIGRNGVTPEELVRYALNLPVAAAVIGMPDVAVIDPAPPSPGAFNPCRKWNAKVSNKNSRPQPGTIPCHTSPPATPTANACTSVDAPRCFPGPLRSTRRRGGGL
jgi:hypothetical protein